MKHLKWLCGGKNLIGSIEVAVFQAYLLCGRSLTVSFVVFYFRLNRPTSLRKTALLTHSKSKISGGLKRRIHEMTFCPRKNQLKGYHHTDPEEERRGGEKHL